MSGFALAPLLVAGELARVLIQRPRSLGPIIPDCAIEERHSDRLETTQHPVELGAEISDHAYRLPVEVTLRYAWSNSTFGAFSEIYIDKVYQALQDLQRSRELFTIHTGKRIYDNMLLTEMSVTTDSHSENSLLVEISCREIIIVKTSAATLPNDPATQAQPENTGSTIDRGPQQAQPVAAQPVTVPSDNPFIPAAPANPVAFG